VAEDTDPDYAHEEAEGIPVLELLGRAVRDGDGEEEDERDGEKVHGPLPRSLRGGKPALLLLLLLLLRCVLNLVCVLLFLREAAGRESEMGCLVS